jgi:hypothetical protein
MVLLLWMRWTRNHETTLLGFDSDRSVILNQPRRPGPEVRVQLGSIKIILQQRTRKHEERVHDGNLVRGCDLRSISRCVRHGGERRIANERSHP